MVKYPLISVICLNWNSHEDMVKLLTSIKRSDYPAQRLEIIVVDNDSTDRSVEIIKRQFPSIKIVQLSKNKGMVGLNAGFQVAKGDYIFSIHSDVVITPDLFRKCVAKLQSDPSIGLLGVKAYDKKSHQYYPSTKKFNFYTGVITSTWPNDCQSTDFDFLEGLVHIFPREILKKVGLIGSTFFFYGDDPDFSMRVRQAGYQLLYFPEVAVYHGKSSSTPTMFPKKFHYYHKAVLQIVYLYGNIIQKVTVTICQLLLIPPLRVIRGIDPTFRARWWGLWWNISHASIQLKIFLVAFITGMAIRIVALNGWDFWFDEAFTFEVARLPLIEVLRAVLSDNNPPLHYLLIHWMMKIGEAQWWLRLPSLIFNLMAIYYVYKIADNAAGKRAGYLAAALMAISPLAIFYATSARLHALGFALVPAGVWYYIQLQQKTAFRNWMALTITCLLGVYTQNYYWLLLLPYLYLAQKASAEFKRYLLVTLVVVVVAFLPWAYLWIFSTHNGCSCTPIYQALPAVLAAPTLGGMGEITLRYFPRLPIYLSLSFAIISLAYFVLFGLGVWRNRVLAAIYLVPLATLATLTLAELAWPIFSPKGFGIYASLFLILVALGMDRLIRNENLLLVCLFSLVAVSVIEVTDPFFAGTKLKPVAALVQSNNINLVAHTSLITFYSTDYYTHHTKNNILLTKNALSEKTVELIGGQQQNLPLGLDYFWLVDSPMWVDNSERAQLLNRLYRNYQVQASYQVGQTRVQLLKALSIQESYP